MPPAPPANVLVPFAHERSGHISVVARLSGVQARLIVDTGSGLTCLDRAMLVHYGLAVTSRSRTGGGLGTSSMAMASVAAHDLRLPGVDLSRIKLFAVDLSHLNVALARARVEPIAGVLGADVLHRRRAVIDYGRGYIVFAG
jgi:hypothetical protein